MVICVSFVLIIIKKVRDPRIELVQADANSSVYLSDSWIDISTDGGVAQEGSIIFPNGKKNPSN